MRILYVGTHAPEGENIVHLPLIRIVARPVPKHILDDLAEYSHLILTSPNAVEIFFRAVDPASCMGKQIFAVGKSTEKALREKGLDRIATAEDERQEGIIALMRPLDLDDAYILLPRSSLARKAIDDFLCERQVRHQVCDLYDTVVQKPEILPDLSSFDEIFFTSPSTVHAFVSVFGKLPEQVKVKCRGAITNFTFQVAKKNFFR